MEPKVKRIAFGLGAEVSGVDLSRPLGRDTAEQLRQAWREHLVLVFHDQDIDHAQHIGFARNFGTPELHPEKHMRDALHPEIFTVSNRVVDGKPSETRNVGRNWHSDGAFTARPPTASLLRDWTMPERAQYAGMHGLKARPWA